MKILSINRSIVLLALRSFSVVGSLLFANYIHTMESEGYKIIETIHIPRAITLATNHDCIAVGTAFGPVKLFDHKGRDELKLPYRGDGGLVFDDNKLMQVSRKGEVFTHFCDAHLVKRLCRINAAIYSIAQRKNHLFFGSDDDMVHTWHYDGKYVRSYTGKQAGHINALQATDKAIVTASSNGRTTSIDRETGSIIWNHHPAHIPALCVIKNHSQCYVGYKNGEMLVGDPDIHPHVVMSFNKKPLFSLAFLKAGYLAVGHESCIGIYDIRKMVIPLIEFMLPKKENVVTALQATEDGFVALTDDGTMQIWEEIQ